MSQDSIDFDPENDEDGYLAVGGPRDGEQVAHMGAACCYLPQDDERTIYAHYQFDHTLSLAQFQGMVDKNWKPLPT